MKSHRILIVPFALILLLWLASVDAMWAAPGQSPSYQCGGTVPCKTPKPASPPPEKEPKDTLVPTSVSPTVQAGMTPLATATSTLLPGAVTLTSMPGTVPASATIAALPATATASSTATSPAQTSTPMPATSSVPLLTSTPPIEKAASATPMMASAAAPASGNWLLWAVGLLLVVAGAVLVLGRSQKQ